MLFLQNNREGIYFCFFCNLLDYELICKKILNIDPKVRFAAVYHSSTEKIAGGFKEGKLPLLPTNEEFQKTILRTIIVRSSHKALEEYCGKEKYALLEFEKIIGCIFPLRGDLVLIVTMEPDCNSNVLVNGVSKIIREQVKIN